MPNRDNHDWIYIVTQIAGKLPITLAMLLLSTLFGLLLGLGIAVVRIQKKPVLYTVATFYLSFMRCTPTLVQLFLVYYGLPAVLQLIGIDVNGWDRFIFVIVTFSLHSAAFFSEVIRSAYLAVGVAQQEAAYSVGMTYFQTLRRIILPQAFGIGLPNFCNDLIGILKETSLAFSIGIVDIMGQAQIIIGNSNGLNVVQVYIVISIVYWILSIAIEKGCGRLERRLKRGHAGIVKPE
ncbi:amino acid ABC transporter permease [Paenibacillus sepulcri]|uniref:Amino acid ABC transporter permease n=1 Tax=Paenibacillus sepulcri TaxID=359917 RepID=A0ABS7C1X8_9BACL|nr:amino acid ABC transporter permease [Paenibacillus sepulcri]